MGATYSQTQRDPLYLPIPKHIQSKDTIFEYLIYHQEYKYIDSIVYKGKITKFSKKEWIKYSDSNFYCVQKFRKTRPSSWFKENNGVLFQADFEVILYAYRWFRSDGTTSKYRRFWLIHPYKKIKLKENPMKNSVPCEALQISPQNQKR